MAFAVISGHRFGSSILRPGKPEPSTSLHLLIHVRGDYNSIWDKAYSPGRETLEIVVFEKVTAGQCRKRERRKGKCSNKVGGMFRTQLVTCVF